MLAVSDKAAEFVGYDNELTDAPPNKIYQSPGLHQFMACACLV